MTVGRAACLAFFFDFRLIEQIPDGHVPSPFFSRSFDSFWAALLVLTRFRISSTR